MHFLQFSIKLQFALDFYRDYKTGLLFFVQTCFACKLDNFKFDNSKKSKSNLPLVSNAVYLSRYTGFKVPSDM